MPHACCWVLSPRAPLRSAGRGASLFLPVTEVFSPCRRNGPCWRGSSAAPLKAPEEGHRDGQASTNRPNPCAKRGLCSFPLHASVWWHAGLHFFPVPKSIHLRRVPEHGLLWTHFCPLWSAPEASSQLLTRCQTTAAGTCPQAGPAAWLGSQPAQLGENESAVPCLLGVRWNVTQRPEEVSSPRVVPAGNSLKACSLRTRKKLRGLLAQTPFTGSRSSDAGASYQPSVPPFSCL